MTVRPSLWKWRVKNGLRIVALELSENDTCEALIVSGAISEVDAMDHKKVCAVLAPLVQRLMTETLREARERDASLP
jgi:hypothetical protein